MASRLAVLFAGDTAPDEDEVRARLAAIGATAMRVEAIDPPEISEPVLAQVRDEGERIAIESARAAIEIDVELAAPVMRSFRAQLDAAAAIAGERAAAVLDRSSGRLIGLKELERLRSTRVPPRARELAVVHSIVPDSRRAGDERGRLWLHTHGLARAGVPDVEALRVRSADRDAAVLVIESLASLLVSGDVAPRAGVVRIGDGLELALLELEDALARLGDDELGSDDSRDDEHTGPRLVIAPAGARRDGSLLAIDELLDRVRAAPAFYESREETERARELARERLPRFRARFERGAKTPGFVFLVKLAFDTRSGAGREHLWFRVVGLSQDAVEGVLESDPIDVDGLARGRRGSFELARLSDWLIVTPADEREGPEG